VVAEHLRWLWGRSRQRDGTWLRSHLTNGRVKDRGVQADQQLYPLLELCEYRRTIGSWPHPPGDDPDDPAAAWGRAVAGEWQRLRATAGHGLLASDENPADDPSQLPYTLSSQILYWHTARQLARWAPELGLADGRFDRDADDVRHAIDEHFTVDGPFGPQWGYETDGQGRHRRYNDANDLPTAFAPLWGFCPASDPHWVATMRFTFSPRNPAYCIGPFGGLGSAHTPGTWPLGDVQQWVAASLAGDRPTAEAVLDKLCRIAAPDGLLPESYDPATGAWLARHWFAWPSAALAALAYC
jgi:hypothetical protein